MDSPDITEDHSSIRFQRINSGIDNSIKYPYNEINPANMDNSAIKQQTKKDLKNQKKSTIQKIQPFTDNDSPTQPRSRGQSKMGSSSLNKLKRSSSIKMKKSHLRNIQYFGKRILQLVLTILVYFLLLYMQIGFFEKEPLTSIDYSKRKCYQYPTEMRIRDAKISQKKIRTRNLQIFDKLQKQVEALEMKVKELDRKEYDEYRRKRK